ncbi:MAG: HAD-IIIA family hydrolase [Ignavibacteriae bacterium]|nr:HAD-IIIA family hydrolase [Ignavibacteriota bacterium]
MSDKKKLVANARRVKMLLFDVDGVMTDGGIYYSVEGVEFKRFNAQDGYGIARARECGLKVGIISGRKSPLVERRAKELNVEELFEGADDKIEAMREIQRRNGLNDQEFAFMADDLFDIPLLRVVGLSAAPRNARPEVKRVVDLVTKADGGNGAVRELIDFVLKHRSE